MGNKKGILLSFIFGTILYNSYTPNNKNITKRDCNCNKEIQLISNDETNESDDSDNEYYYEENDKIRKFEDSYIQTDSERSDNDSDSERSYYDSDSETNESSDE